MAIYRVEKTKDFTVMSNYHLKDKTLSLKSKGLLSMILALPEEWNFTIRGFATICKEGVDSIGAALKELETHGYIKRFQIRDEKGKIKDTEYVIYEVPHFDEEIAPHTTLPYTNNPHTENPDMDDSNTENPTQLNTYILNNNIIITNKENERMNENASVREKICQNIEYEYLIKIHDILLVDEVVDVMIEAITSKKPYQPVGKFKRAATSELANQFLSYKEEHIEFILNSLERVNENILSRPTYIRTMLYNLPERYEEYEEKITSDM